jgi:pimeloyl-ACP methyl ester carboxylesterase
MKIYSLLDLVAMKNFISVFHSFFLLSIMILSLAGCKAPEADRALYSVIRADSLRYPAYGDNIEPTDYSDPDNWLAIGSSGGLGADVFFLYPTSWRANGDYPIASIDNAEMRGWADYYLKTRTSAFETAGNIYAPFYRQLDAAFLLSRSVQSPAEAIGLLGGVTLTDVNAAFEYYIKHYNKGKPFIIAAHSQGTAAALALLVTYLKERPEIYNRMIAAYMIGVPIRRQFYDIFPHLKPAQSADDLGVIISYNTNSPTVDGQDAFFNPDNVLINPITWVTDDSYAPASASKGGIIASDDGTFINVPHLSDARIDPATGTLVSTADKEKFSSEAASRGYFPLGMLHENDIPLYYYDLRANAENRVEKWFLTKGK